MSMTASIWLILVVALMAANLPFINERVVAFGPRLQPNKGWRWRLLELTLLLAITLGVGFLVESRIGQRHAQGWEFYVAMACLFLTLSFPGFVWRYLRRGHAE